ncbi:hypothetical protein D3C73_769100 [compost metagenome]
MHAKIFINILAKGHDNFIGVTLKHIKMSQSKAVRLQRCPHNVAGQHKVVRQLETVGIPFLISIIRQLPIISKLHFCALLVNHIGYGNPVIIHGHCHAGDDIIRNFRSMSLSIEAQPVSALYNYYKNAEYGCYSFFEHRYSKPPFHILKL